ncbi:uncharacterized protein CEXT_167041 [Caerostris extrusa]|uniref:Uncharacterized protein n=1 Tax=Caerostris extrusa TaxID=172846 RepID=A0AAV4T0N2_CAEEX|nr:uncharacterized protein CEXT_167041 [Caerostris extrusa]
MKDKQVQEYFELEPEDIVLARVHTLYNENRKQDAMSLARASFLYHSRIRKSFKNASSDKGGIGGHSTIDWYMLTAEDLNINDLIDEIEKLKCCERTEILCRLWRKGSENIDLRGH